MESSKVQVMESCLVAPSEATPTKGLWLSPLDLALADRGHTPLVFFYPSGDTFSNVARLKEGMAKALVLFYPFAGRLSVGDDGRVQITCNGEGALFVAASSCLVAADVDFTTPSPELRRVFVPRMEPSSLIFAAQVTFLKCGGVVLGVAVHHAAVDGPSTFHFMQTWSAFTRDGGAAVELPCHDRTLLRARSPPVVHPGALSVLCPKVTFSEASPPTATAAFTISGERLAALKRLCGGASTFCSVSALLWRCASVARRLPPDATTRISFAVNIRRRRSLRPPLPARYFGNGLVLMAAAAAAREIASEALASVADRIAGTLARMDDEVARSSIDYLELEGAGRMGVRQLKGSMPETELRVVSWRGMQAYDADFGCGAPAVLSRAESVRGGFAHVIDDGPTNQRGGGDVRVVMCMEAVNMEKFERLLYANITMASRL